MKPRMIKLQHVHKPSHPKPFALHAMVSTGPMIPQALLVAGTAAIGYAPELWPWELGKAVVIVSTSFPSRSN